MLQVSYRLSIDGSPASEQLVAAIREIEVEDHADLADMLRLKLAVAVDDGGSSWSILDEDIFQRLTALHVSVGVGSAGYIPLIEAHVIETRAHFSHRPGESIVEVVAMDPTVLMNLEEKVRAWPDMADSDIANVIFGEYGFDFQIEQTQPTRQQVERTTMQRGTDIQFLRELAQRNGYECYVELNADTGRVEGHFHPPQVEQTQQGVLSVNLGSATNVNRFEARYDMLRPFTAQAANLDTSGQSDQSADIDTTATSELGETGTSSGASNQRRVLIANTGLTDSGELQTYTQAMVDRSSWAIRADGEVSTVTYGDVIRAKRPLNVRGAGRQFSGTYYVNKVLHRLSDSGYTQTFSLQRNASGVTGQESFVEDQALAG